MALCRRNVPRASPGGRQGTSWRSSSQILRSVAPATAPLPRGSAAQRPQGGSMTSHRVRGLPFLVRALMAAALALAAVLALQAARADAAPGTQVWTGQASGPTPDISDSGYTFLDQ